MRMIFDLFFPFFGFFWFPLGFIFFLLILFFAFRLLFWPWRRHYWGYGGYGYWHNPDDATEILRQRYARGEITKEQFTQMMQDLQEHK